MNELRERIEAGRFVPVIDRRYPLAAIAEAYRYVQTAEKAGIVVIDVVAEGRLTIASYEGPGNTGKYAGKLQ